MKSIKDNICKKLSKKYGLDQRIVRLIADQPIKFSKKIIADDNNIRPIRVRYFGVFAPKYSYVKQFHELKEDRNHLENLNNSVSEI